MAGDSITREGKSIFGLERFTTRPDTFGERYVNSAVTWLLLNVLWAIADALMTIFPSGGRPYEADDWVSHVVFVAFGLLAIWCMHHSGFPAAWDTRFAAKVRLWLPIAAGLAFGLVAAVTDLLTGASKIIAAIFGAPFNIGFPGSLFASVGGSVKFEALFLIVPVPVLLWLISNLVLRGRGQAPAFWVLAVLSSLLEPVVFQGVPLVILSQGALTPGAYLPPLIEGFAMNFAAAALFRRHGLLSAVLVRLGHYLVWHVGYGFFFP